METRPLRLPALVALLLIALAGPAHAQTRRAATPTARQVRAAVQKAEHSKNLWSTINVCNTKRHRNTIGIRGQMPGLGFSAQLRMRFGVEYWTGKAFTRLRGLERSVALGAAGGLHQAGVMFSFGPQAGRLRGSVTFEWRYRRKLIGHARATTTLHHRSADYGDPKGFSSEECVIP